MLEEYIKYEGNNLVHKTALIKNCTLGKDNIIGPYCILRNADIGDGNTFESHVSIGAPPEIRGFEGSLQKVWIKSRNVFKEFVTVNAGSKNLTVIGNDCVLFTKSHVSHDAELGDHVTLCGSACVGGHCLIDNFVTIGGGSLIHQFVMVGFGSMLGQGASITQHIPPFSKMALIDAKYIGKNDYLINRHEWELDFIHAQEALWKKRVTREILKDDRKGRRILEPIEGLIQGPKDR